MWSASFSSFIITESDICGLTPASRLCPGLEGDADLQFLLVGGDLVKIRSRSWKKSRFFKLQEDCRTFWHESHKTFRRNQTCECLPVPLLVLTYLFSFHDSRLDGS